MLVKDRRKHKIAGEEIRAPAISSIFFVKIVQ